MTGDATVNTRTFGTGPRNALAIHCTLGHAGNWRGLGDVLSDRLTLTALDLPGHGRSADWDGLSDYQDVCVAAALPLFGAAPLDLIGHSFGATVALRIAVDFPERVRTLTLIEPVLFAAAKQGAPDVLEQHLAEAHPYSHALAAKNWALAARLFNRLWGDGTKWDNFRAAARDYMTHRVHIVAAQADAIFCDRPQILGPGRLEQADMPVLLVQGTESPAIISAINDVLLRRLPKGKRVSVSGAGHMVPLSHAEALAAHINDLLEMT